MCRGIVYTNTLTTGTVHAHNPTLYVPKRGYHTVSTPAYLVSFYLYAISVVAFLVVSYIFFFCLSCGPP